MRGACEQFLENTIEMEAGWRNERTQYACIAVYEVRRWKNIQK